MWLFLRFSVTYDGLPSLRKNTLMFFDKFPDLTKLSIVYLVPASWPIFVGLEIRHDINNIYFAGVSFVCCLSRQERCVYNFNFLVYGQFPALLTTFIL